MRSWFWLNKSCNTQAKVSFMAQQIRFVAFLFSQRFWIIPTSGSFWLLVSFCRCWCMFVWALKHIETINLWITWKQWNLQCNFIAGKNQNKRLFSLFNGHFWAIATAEACKGEAKLSSTLWIVAMSHMSTICFCYVLLVSNMFDHKSTWTDDCYIISPRVSCFFQKLVAQPPELSQLCSSLTKGRLTKGAALPWAFSPREFPWWRSIGGPWMPVQCDVRRHGMVGHVSIEFP